MHSFKKIAMIFLALIIWSCGDKKEEKETITIGGQETNERATTTSGSNIANDDGIVEIRLTGDDQMRFDKKEIRVKQGQTVRLTFTHVGKMEKNVMGHNFVLLTPGTDINQFGQEAVNAAANDYIPRNTNKVIVHTKMLGGGESTVIEFEAPAPGTYDFICSFPGHYAIMKGKFIVE